MQNKGDSTDCLHIICYIIAFFTVATGYGTY